MQMFYVTGLGRNAVFACGGHRATEMCAYTCSRCAQNEEVLCFEHGPTGQ